jgi:hypothetical protein
MDVDEKGMRKPKGESQTKRLTLMVIFNGVFFVLVFWCELCFVL